MFYRCDPRKNTSCRKTTCYVRGGNCSLTSNPKCRCEGTKEVGETSGGYITKQQEEIAQTMLLGGYDGKRI